MKEMDDSSYGLLSSTAWWDRRKPQNITFNKRLSPGLYETALEKLIVTQIVSTIPTCYKT
jgi:hypothetical protein